MRSRHSMRMSLLTSTTLIAVALLMSAGEAQAQPVNGQLVISTSTYVPTGEQTSLTVGQQITVDGTGLTKTTAGVTTSINAVAGAGNLGVFTNHVPDGNFGLTSPLSISFLPTNTGGTNAATLAASGFVLPTSQIVTSFPSKSEGSLYLTPST